MEALLQAWLGRYGYWALAGTMLLENAGVPVPGEMALLFASFLASSQHHLQLHWIVVVATVAAATGDNIGYAVGRWGGRPLLDRYRNLFRITSATLERGEHLFRRYGPAAVFLARFIFGLRVLAGPLAGVLRMPWKRFTLFNVLGAATWVVTVATLGYLFGQHRHLLSRLIAHTAIAAALLVSAVVAFVWWKRRREA